MIGMITASVRHRWTCGRRNGTKRKFFTDFSRACMRVRAKQWPVAGQRVTAEFATATARMIARRPASMSHFEAAALPIVGVTAWQMLFDHAQALRPPARTRARNY
jgi:NADPH:quinone reductase-like Zn-dependent oxidoreductase